MSLFRDSYHSMRVVRDSYSHCHMYIFTCHMRRFICHLQTFMCPSSNTCIFRDSYHGMRVVRDSYSHRGAHVFRGSYESMRVVRDSYSHRGAHVFRGSYDNMCVVRDSYSHRRAHEFLCHINTFIRHMYTCICRVYTFRCPSSNIHIYCDSYHSMHVVRESYSHRRTYVFLWHMHIFIGQMYTFFFFCRRMYTFMCDEYIRDSYHSCLLYIRFMTHIIICVSFVNHTLFVVCIHLCVMYRFVVRIIIVLYISIFHDSYHPIHIVRDSYSHSRTYTFICHELVRDSYQYCLIYMYIVTHIILCI